MTREKKTATAAFAAGVFFLSLFCFPLHPSTEPENSSQRP